jgi:hypothetical protein
VAGTTLLGLTNFSSSFNLSSGTVVEPILGSMVQKGKFAAWALPELIQLNKVDLPTLGNPTIPHFKDIIF